MDQPAEFDAFYKDVRDRLLVEAYALTGDLAVSRTAVRDGLAVAWHHWNKVRRVDDRIGWVRPHVWRRARHRHNARPWHRERNLPDDVKETLEALNGLSLNQRKALVLTHLSPVPMGQLAREIGVTARTAEDLVTSANTDFAQARGCTVEEVGLRLEGLRTVIAGRWPRSTILRRAGTARRRTHAVAGVLATLALVVASGSLVAQGSDDDAALAEQGFSRRPMKVDTVPEVPTLSEESLLAASQLRRVDRGLTWTVGETHDNTTGDGLVLPCQSASFADPDGLGAYVRTFSGAPRKKRDAGAAAVQMVELSRTPEDAEETYRTALGWFTACSAPSTQLVGVHSLPDVGDEASVVTLRQWRGPDRTVQVAVARTGQIVSTTMTQVKGGSTAPERVASVLGASVNALCGQSGAGACSAPPKPRRTDVPRAGEVPGMLSEWDMPPISGTRESWVGTTAKELTKNEASTRCDTTAFTGKSIRIHLSRTFLFPKAAQKNPTFGLTQTAGLTRNAAQTRKFVEGVRAKMARCSDEELSTEVTRIVDQRGGKSELTAWHVESELPGDRSLEVFMAIIRHGNTVSQVGFVPAGKLEISRADFADLSKRALERLPRLRLEQD
ncbi:hypothetical protein [Nocardioides daphniae]|uniref:RNA polymerase sigma factor 70 region 4 type 2 domain-containing protein n=1 Tax=Nocardioides daphniae TaxID=402297 RepID=A0A4P7UGW5_9ACTN|nr:hypothetical protein [Nocardioides daphniae]QCC77939.1 hypothetical protein E2C04_13475 [Nocardioides daphniae]GGD23816.1 hypothetical protein GCM10007231_23670 [Nocardioides daphniae]